MGLVTSLVRVRVRVRVMGLVTLNDRVMGLVTPLGQSVRQTVVGLVRFTWSPWNRLILTATSLIHTLPYIHIYNTHRHQPTKHWDRQGRGVPCTALHCTTLWFVVFSFSQMHTSQSLLTDVHTYIYMQFSLSPFRSHPQVITALSSMLHGPLSKSNPQVRSSSLALPHQCTLHCPSSEIPLP